MTSTSTSNNLPTFPPNEYTIRWVPLNSSDVRSPIVILLLGATGTGKSAFIEALVGDPSLGISGDTLVLTTREVASYSLENIRAKTTSSDRNIVIVDTPGFSADIADVEYTHYNIVHKMIPAWMQANDIFAFTHVLYFERVGPSYPSGSQMIANKLFSTMLGEKKPPKVHIVSTLWDRSFNKKIISLAAQRYNGLEKQWKSILGTDCQIRKFKFMNTQDSALYILGQCLTEADSEISSRTHMSPNNPWMQDLYQDLRERAIQVQMLLANAHGDFNTSSIGERRDDDVPGFLENETRRAEGAMKRIMQQLEEFGPPPDSTAPPVESTTADINQVDPLAGNLSPIRLTSNSDSMIAESLSSNFQPSDQPQDNLPRERQVESTSSTWKTWRRYLGRFLSS